MLRLFECYIVLNAMLGMELVAFAGHRCREFDAWHRKFGRWLLLGFSAPDSAVLGDLGWHPWSALAQESAVSLRCRLLHAAPLRPAFAVAAVSSLRPGSWAQQVSSCLIAVEEPTCEAHVASHL